MGTGAQQALSVDSLREAARAATGLDESWPAELGGEFARSALEVLLAAIEKDAGLGAEAAAGVFHQLSGLLATRQLLAEDRRRSPAIAAERVERPLIVIGMPRSGTTLLHALLAEDPANRAPRMWERCFPSPPPGTAAPDDRRRAQTDEIVQTMLATYPGLLTAHPYWDALAEATVECEDFCQLAFASGYFQGWLHVPTYTDWLFTTDQAPVYAFHRSFLQQLQFGAPARRWALKSPSHAYFIDSLHAEYPDAVFIWPHRDPTEQVASTLELVAVIRNAESAAARAAVRDDSLQYIDHGLRQAVASPLLDDPAAVCHVAYRDLVADPVGTVRDIYTRYDVPFSEEFARRMRRWLADPGNKSDRHGTFSYDLGLFGLTAEDIAARYSFYRDRVRDLGFTI